MFFSARLGFMSAGSGGSGYPPTSLDFEVSSAQSLSMAIADFGTFDRAKFAVSFWMRLESLSDDRPIFGQLNGGAGQSAPYIIGVRGSGKITVQASALSGSFITGNQITTATYATATWYHVLAHYDSANATPGDRMRLWIDGAEVTSFDSDSAPSDPIKAETGPMQWGSGGFDASAPTYFDGLIYQPLFFSGVLPDISLLYDAGNPVDPRAVSGLFSFLDNSGGDVTSDYVLSAPWVNNNGVTTSGIKP